MTVTIPEIITGAPTAAATTGYTVTTSLVPSDVVVVILGKPSSGSYTIAGLGATWTAHGDRQLAGSNTRVIYTSATGITGGGTVSITLSSTATQPHVAILVLRGMSSGLAAIADSTWYEVNGSLTGEQTVTPGGTDEGPAALSASVGQVALFVACVSTSTQTNVTFPSNPTPAGWVDDITPAGAIGSFRLAHLIVTSGGNVQANVQCDFNRSLGTTMLLFGAAESSPLTSTFVGWGNPIL